MQIKTTFVHVCSDTDVICTYILHILVNLCLKYVLISLIYILYS